jgi:chemotaxis protein histidine kinase CheA
MALNGFAERLARVRQRFISGLESKIEDTYRDIPGLSQAAPAGAETVEEAYRRIHSLVGIGPTVGFARTGRAARSVEHILLMPQQAKRGLTNQEVDSFEKALHVLRETASSELQMFYSDLR